MRLASLVCIAASACRPAPAPLGPEAMPALRLVACAPAIPLPRTATDLGHSARLDGERGFGEIEVATLARQRSHAPAPPPEGSPAVVAGTPTVLGPLDGAVVERLVRSHLSELRGCYERELAADPGMTGTVTVTFVAGPDGRVMTTSVLGSGVAPAVSACVVQVVQTLQFPTGQTTSVVYPFQFVTAGERVEPPRDAPAPALRPDAPWTPFALGDDAPAAAALRVARATEAAIRRRAARLDGCFSGPAPVGSLRAMLAVRGDGAIAGARTGGLGDPGEACVARRLVDVPLGPPLPPLLPPAAHPERDPVEIACDFARGEARPWRVAPAAGYAVLEAGPRGVRHGADLIPPGAVSPRPLRPGQTFLVIVSPDTPGAVLDLALEWTEQGDATLVALRDGPRAPLVVGVARTAHQIGGTERVTAWPALRVGRKVVTACVDRGSQRAPLADPVAVDALVQRAAARCRALRCSASLGVVIDAGATASQLFDVAGAARRAGFQRVLLGSYAACAAAPPDRGR